ncbi:DUF4232 domain-containing protein [Streptomyces xinghaiensis]|uniref:DUF4232 domain-containing protein n=1 Tax=Streptomyces xinghaiensis TaxID=1038928 RepID=UPI00030D9C8C|nr:DUF4232 domain-containing protein [Streptomyces xinghaiensis]
MYRPGVTRRFRPAPLGAVVLSVLAMATACGNDSAPPPSGPGSAHPTGAASDSRPATGPSPAGTSAEPSVPGTTHAGTPRCTRGDLGLSLGRVSPGAGNLYAPLVFTNTGSGACTLRGFPGVTLLDGTGDRIGAPAERQGETYPAVVLTSGDSAYAALHTVNEGVSDEPCREPADRVQAYPPGSTWALRADARGFTVCGGVFEVSAVRPGTGP